MKFTEEKLERAFVQLLGNDNDRYVKMKKIFNNSSQ